MLPCPHPFPGATVSYLSLQSLPSPRFHCPSLCAVRGCLERGLYILGSSLAPLSVLRLKPKAAVVNPWLWMMALGIGFIDDFSSGVGFIDNFVLPLWIRQNKRCPRLLRSSPEDTTQPSCSSLSMHPVVISWSRDGISESGEALV